MRQALIDTNVCSAYFGGSEDILDTLASAETVWISVIVLGELEAGFRSGSKYRENKAILKRFLAKQTVRVLDITNDTSLVFGQIKQSLRRAGTPIPINDLWLASQAMQTGSVLLTYDKHFLQVKGLRLWDLLLT